MTKKLDMPPFIQNISLAEVIKGHHMQVNNCILIQIVDTDMDFPVPFFKEQFKHIYQFKFLDIEEDNPSIEKMGFTKKQAKEIAQILNLALENKMNVIVHCVAGVCRSGAVCEIGVMMGFIDTEAFRIPNTYVKKLLMQELGWSYAEVPDNDNSIASPTPTQ